MATGQFGPPILAYFGPFLTNFSAKSAIFLVRAGSGHPKSGPGQVGPLKTHVQRAKFRVGLWPDPALYLTRLSLLGYNTAYLVSTPQDRLELEFDFTSFGKQILPERK